MKNAESAETEESAEIMRAENANAENMGNAHNTSQPNLLIFSTFLSSHLDFDIPLMTNFFPHMSFFPHVSLFLLRLFAIDAAHLTIPSSASFKLMSLA